jgi:hypothetical protein
MTVQVDVKEVRYNVQYRYGISARQQLEGCTVPVQNAVHQMTVQVDVKQLYSVQDGISARQQLEGCSYR